MVDFASALNTRASDIEKPPILPQGTYIWSVNKIPTFDKSKSGEWEICEFQVVPVQPESDVDEDDLAAFGDLRGGINRISFMFPTDPAKEPDFKKSLFRLKNFLTKTLKVDVEDDATVKEMLDASVNCQFLANATWRQVEDDTYVDVKNYAPLD